MTLSNIRTKIISENINIVLRHEKELTDWELGFIKSTHKYYTQKGDLSPRHFNTLKNVADKYRNK
ncbi:MAG TPA: hypothetical protein VI815_02355 [Candidatus Nanoarchaeia archaeon]|nr:hypothetical protein [Candidatus Nanoarchaeia archaeon]